MFTERATVIESTLAMRERRQEDRWKEHVGSAVAMDGFPGKLQDLSPSGTRITTTKTFEPGTQIRLDLSWGNPIRATVIACENGQVRLSFDTPIDPLI
jgi:hypothetical protein